MTRTSRTRASVCLLALLVAAASTPAAAQIGAASARASGMGNAYGAVARGLTAGVYNPANLALPGNPAVGFHVVSATVDVGLGPVDLDEIEEYAGDEIPESVRQAWLERVRETGGLRLGADADVNALGFSFGPLAFNVGTTAGANMRMPTEAAELFLGTGDDFGADIPLATDARARGFGASFVSLSYGQAVRTRGEGDDRSVLALGVTAKYVVGHGLFQIQDVGSGVAMETGDPGFRFPMLTLWNEDGIDAASGIGFDLGVAYQASRLSLGLTVHDLVNTLKWNEDHALVRGGSGFVLEGEDETDGPAAEYGLDDAALPEEIAEAAREAISSSRFKPAIRASAAYQVGSKLLLASDLLLRTGSESSLVRGESFGWSTGAEFRWLGGLLPLRGGMGVRGGGFAWTLGTGLEAGFVNLNVAYGRRSGGDLGAGDHASIGLTFGSGR